MGLFSKKEKVPGKIPVQYYDGELREFTTNCPCNLLLLEDALVITKVNPYVEVKLSKQRIISVDIFLQENQYVAKYKGTNVTTTQCKTVPKHYYVINYLNKDEEHRHIDFWGTVNETGKMNKIREELSNNQMSTRYEI